MLETWLRKKCKDEITAICKKVYPQVKKYGVAFPEIQLREMVSRWGSCSPKKGFVTFNTALIAMPVSCIEYVVTHEFTHFLYPNHSKKFYQQLATFMPDWEERKKGWKGEEHPLTTPYTALFPSNAKCCLFGVTLTVVRQKTIFSIKFSPT